MPIRQIRDPEQKHMISRKPEESSMTEQSKTQLEDAPKNPKRRRGRRKGKGSQVDGRHDLHVDEHSSSNKNIVFKQRPGFGQLGSKCIAKVKITPEVNSNKLNKAIMAQQVELHRETDLGARLPVYDGKMNLYTVGLLPFMSKEFAVALTDLFEKCDLKRKNEFKVKIEFIGFARVQELHGLLAGKHVKTPQETRAILDTIFRELAAKRYPSVGRLLYSPNIQKPHQLGGGLHSWRGFYQSVRLTQMGLALNIDMFAGAFIESLPVVEFIAQILSNDVRLKPLSHTDSVKVKKALRGIKVEVTHRGNLRRKYRVSGLSGHPTRELILPVDKQMNMKSVIEYFQQRYGFAIKYAHLPCLQVGSQKKVKYLPMEACKIVEGHRYTNRLNESQIASLLKATCKRPCKQEADILQIVHRSAYNEDPLAQEFGISIDDKLAKVEARVLPPPWLKYNDAGKEKQHLPQLGQWNMINKKVINGSTVNHWTYINFSRSVQESVSRGFCRQLVQMCQVSGMEFNPEPMIPIHCARPEQVKEALRYVQAESKLEGKDLKLVIAILPENNGSLYGLLEI